MPSGWHSSRRPEAAPSRRSAAGHDAVRDRPGKPPAFFEGDPLPSAGLRFNVETESFQFYAPVKMKGDPLWVDVTVAFREGRVRFWPICST